MSETVNIAALATSASQKIFSAFGWDIHPIMDETFDCEKIEKHQTKGSGGKHPVDCVFSYRNPFSNESVLLLCDLKSYASPTISTKDFAPYIRTLSKAIDCAATSNQWQTRYVSSSISDWTVEGLLFVYNHDSNYDNDFKKKAKGLSPSKLPHSRFARIHLLGPDDISHLQSVVTDMKSHCSDQNLNYDTRKFFFPQQLLYTPANSLLPVAPIELLRGKLIISAFTKRDSKEIHCLVYLRCEGSITDFEYAITYIYRNGVINIAEKIEIKGVSFSPEAQIHFDKAKEQFLGRHYRMKEMEDSLGRITFGRADRIVTSFSSVDESKRRNR